MLNVRCPNLEQGNSHYDALVDQTNNALKTWAGRDELHREAILRQIRDDYVAATERATQLRSLLVNIVNFVLVACGAVAVLSQSILATQPLLLAIPFLLFAVAGGFAAYGLSPPHVTLSDDWKRNMDPKISEEAAKDDGWKLAIEISERATTVIRQNVLEWQAKFVRIPIVIFILALVSLPLAVAFADSLNTTNGTQDGATIAARLDDIDNTLSALTDAQRTTEAKLAVVTSVGTDEHLKLSREVAVHVDRLEKTMAAMQKALGEQSNSRN